MAMAEVGDIIEVGLCMVRIISMKEGVITKVRWLSVRMPTAGEVLRA